MSETSSAVPSDLARPWRRWRVPLVVVGVVLVVVGVTAAPGVRRGLIDPEGREPVVGVTEVDVRDDFWEYFAYTPSVIEVPAGTTVTWSFTSDAPHNVVFAADAPGGALASPTLEAGATWSRTFDAPGTYRYTCTLHPGMDGRVEVVVAP